YERREGRNRIAAGPAQSRDPPRRPERLLALCNDSRSGRLAFRGKDGLVWISGRAVHIERAKRGDLIHVGIQHADGRRIPAPSGREPYRSVLRELYLGRVGREL